MFSSPLSHAEILICGCIFCMVMALCIYLSNNFNSKRRKCLFCLQAFTSLLLFNSAIAVLFRGSPGVLNFFAARMGSFMTFALRNVIILFFHVYECSYLFTDDAWKRDRRVKYAGLLCLLGVVLVILSQDSDLYYYFDTNNVYYRGRWYFLSLLIPSLSLLMDLSLLLQFRKKLRRIIFFSLLSFIVLTIGTAAVQLLYNSVALINMAMGLAMTIMFISSMSEQNLEMYQLLKKKTEVEERLSISMTLNQSVKALSANVDTDAAINELLGIINAYFDADRCYIFETIHDGKALKNTYEHVRAGVSAQIENLQDVPIDVISIWMASFEKNEAYFMSTLDQEKGSAAYNMLQEQQVDRLLAVPLKKQDEIIGFLGVDNPRKHYDDPTLLSTIRYFIMNSVERKERRQQLEKLSYRDMLTGLYNRNKYIRVLEASEGKSLHDVGVAYMDLNGLKKMNDEKGHEAGDDLIRAAAGALTDVFPDQAFRVGGDEFVIIREGISETAFSEKIDQLRENMERRKVSVSIGDQWAAEERGIEEMLKRADHRMYEEKKRYYQTQD